MGILLSKPDEESVPEKNGASTRKAPRKRKGGLRDGEMGTIERTRKRQRKLSHTRTPSPINLSFLETDIIIHKDISMESWVNASNSILNTSDSQGLPPRRKKRPRLEPKAHSDDSPRGLPKEENTSLGLSDAVTTPPNAHLKRKAPTSPYFKVSAMQLSSPPPTPTSSEKSLKERSKISVIETGPMPSSLPHFRPTSPEEFGLIQEKLRYEPWKMLVAVILLNVTTAKMALPLLGQLFERWPTPETLSQGLPFTLSHLIIANFEELSTFLYPIGLYNTRAKRLIDFSTMWLSNPPRPGALTRRKGLANYPPTAISHLPGVSSSSFALMIDGRVRARFMENVLCG